MLKKVVLYDIIYDIYNQFYTLRLKYILFCCILAFAISQVKYSGAICSRVYLSGKDGTMRRKVSLLLSIVLLSGLLAIAGTMVAHASSIKPKKIVSIVYDDSGSMYDAMNSWEYASYGIQAMAGLLDEDDVLFVTYMSNPDVYVEYSLSDKQDSVDKIRNHNTSGATPAKSIETANSALQDYYSNHSSEASDYWLITFTDGGLNENAVMEDKVKEAVSSDNTMGFKLNNMYFPLGDDALIKNEKTDGVSVIDKNGDGKPDKLADGNAFIEALGIEADIISGRIRIDKSQIQKTGDNTLEFKYRLPLYNIEVLSQKSAAVVEKATCVEKELTIASSVALQAPDKMSDELKGTATLINNKPSNIPASTYTIRFKDKVNLDSIVIMVEPAIDIKLTVERNGQRINSGNPFTEGDKLNLKGTVVEAGTDNPIDISLLPASTTFETGYRATSASDNASEDHYDDLILKAEETELYTSVIIPGCLPITDSLTVHPQLPPDYTVKSNPDNFHLTQSNLRNGDAQPLVFTIYKDGKPIDYNEAKTLNFTASTSCALWNDWMLEGKAELQSDGTFVYTPAYSNDFAAWCVSFATIPFGNSINANINGKDIDSVQMFIWWAFPFDFLLNLLQMLIFAYLVHLLIKPKFPFFGKLSLYKVHYSVDSGVSTSQKRITNLLTVFVPSRRTRIKLNDNMILKAAGFRRHSVIVSYRQSDRIVYDVQDISVNNNYLRNVVHIANIPMSHDQNQKSHRYEKTVTHGKALFRIVPGSRSLTEYGIRRNGH